MLVRFKDKVPEIRSQAVTALQRLQDPKDDECPIIKVINILRNRDAPDIDLAVYSAGRISGQSERRMPDIWPAVFRFRNRIRTGSASDDRLDPDPGGIKRAKIKETTQPKDRLITVSLKSAGIKGAM
jgi:hypothetical protein